MLEEILALAKAGYNKEEIALMMKPADPKQADPKQADPKQANPKQADPKQADPERQSEVEFLRKQVQDLQALNLLYASGKGPAQQESEADIMRLLMNGRE